jgi:hypothetical protein
MLCPRALALCLCLCLWSGAEVRAQDSDSSDRRAQEPVAAQSGFDRFGLILQRNIFDPERRPARPESERGPEAPPPPPTQRIALVGVYMDAHQTLALFDGSSSEYRATRTLGERIAEFEVARITTDEVLLRKGDREVALRVGAGLMRQNDSEWELTTDTAGLGARPTPSTSESESTTNSSEGGTDAQEVLRRLMERRKQETGR